MAIHFVGLWGTKAVSVVHLCSGGHQYLIKIMKVSTEGKTETEVQVPVLKP